VCGRPSKAGTASRRFKLERTRSGGRGRLEPGDSKPAARSADSARLLCRGATRRAYACVTSRAWSDRADLVDSRRTAKIQRMPLTVVVALTWAEKMLALSTLASAVVLGLTVVAVFAQLNESQKTRLAALVSDLSRRWDEEAFRAARIKMTNATPNEICQLVEKAYDDPAERNKEFYDLQALANFLETLGVLEALSGGLTIELIDGLYGSSILNTWISWEPTVQFLRSRSPHPGTAYQNFQALYLKIKDRRDHVPV